MKLLIIFFTCFLLSVHGAVAQYEYEEDDLLSLYDEEELISIATGTEKQVRFAPSVASVITAEDIKNSGARTLDEALEMVPGLHVSASFNRQDSIYSIRGIHTGSNPQVLLLVDGVQVTQLFSGARPYNYTLPSANIKRIEVIRGPGSAVYGADAFSGVISVTTKSNSKQEGVVVGGRIGSFDKFESVDTREAWITYGGELSGLDISASLEHVITDGDTSRLIFEDAQSLQIPPIANASASLAPGPMETRYELLNAQLKLGGEGWKLGAFSWNLSDGGLGTGGAQALDPVGRDSTDYYGINLDIEPVSYGDYFTLSGKLGAMVLDTNPEFILFPPGAEFIVSAVPFITVPFPDGVIGNPSATEKTYYGEVVGLFSGAEGHSIRAAVGFSLHDLEAGETKNFSMASFGTLVDVAGTSEIFISDEEREHYYVSIQEEWRFADDWELTAGIRYDTFTQFGDSVNPRLALVWSTSHNLTSKFLYGRAFRAPSFSELYAANNPALLGNPELDPETIDTYEIAFDYRLNHDLGLRLNLFYYEIDDLVEIKFGVPASNAIEQSGHGLEFEFDWQATENLSFVGNYAWQEAEDDNTNQDIPNAPGQQIYLRSVLDISSHLTFSNVVNWVADRERGAGDLRPDIDDYLTFDSILRYSGIEGGLDVAIVARNLFNEDVREPSTGQFPSTPEIPDDYPMEGRSINLEFTYQVQ